jgi:hypothetical protein
MLRRVPSATEANANIIASGTSEWEELRCEQLLYEARSELHPYKRFFTQWLSGEEFFELFKNAWRPLPTEPPNQGTIKAQIDLVGGLEFYTKLRSIWEPDSSLGQSPDRADLLALVGKVVRFCGWETNDPMALPSNMPQLPPLSDIREIRETLVTMLVLINNLIDTQAPSSPIPLPELGSMQIDASEAPDHNP